MNITVNPELLAYIDPLTADEREALERSLRGACLLPDMLFF